MCFYAFNYYGPWFAAYLFADIPSIILRLIGYQVLALCDMTLFCALFMYPIDFNSISVFPGKLIFF